MAFMPIEKKSLIVWAILLPILLFAIIYIYFIPEKEPVIGGCGAVHPDYIQECCDRWAEENNIIKIQCVGYWEVENNKCSWKCGSPQDNENACLMNGGKWVEKQIGGFLDLNINSDEECESWGGNCGKERVISSFEMGKCDDDSGCWMLDIWNPTCLLRK